MLNTAGDTSEGIEEPRLRFTPDDKTRRH